MSHLIPIGRFSQMTQLSIKALRIYAEQGLLSPAYVDPDSGYRYYSRSQVGQAAFIRMLRTLEMPLEQIRAVIHANDPSLQRELLTRHQAFLADQVAHYQHALGLLQRLLTKGGDMMTYDIHVKEIDPEPMLSIRFHTPSNAFEYTVPPVMTELLDYVQEQNLLRDDLRPFIMNHDYNEEFADIEVGIPVPHATTGKGRISSRTLQGGTVAYVVHTGPYEELSLIYPALASWIHEHGYEFNGSPWTAYLNNPVDVVDPSEYRTEIVWPVRK